MKALLLTSTIPLAGGTGAALAQDNGSGFCTADYLPAPRGAEGIAGEPDVSAFAEMDTDGDGMVSQAEYIACRNAASGTQWVETDRGAENMAEADADEQLTREEFLAAAAQAHGAVAASSDPGPDAIAVLRRYIFVPVDAPEADMAAMTAEDAAARSERQFEAFDANADGSVSREEWQETAATVRDRTDELTESFAKLDADSSGHLSEDEFRAAYPAPEAPAAEGASLQTESESASN
jgi:Ca2+-binding EF-hand superfamily protein